MICLGLIRRFGGLVIKYNEDYVKIIIYGNSGGKKKIFS